MADKDTKQAPADRHIKTVAEGRAHKPKKQLDDGACIWGHDGGYSRNWSCSYRWQAHEHSKSDGERKKVHNKRVDGFIGSMSGKVATLQYQLSPGKQPTPVAYATKINKPREPEDWYLEGPDRAGYKQYSGAAAIPVKKNFQKDTWPYWHNSHHLIPKGTLLSAIDAAGKKHGFNANKIRLALLKIKYNVNHYKNVLILPQDEEVAELFRLPRHLILGGSRTKPSSIASEYLNHKEYNENVEAELEKIFDQFVKNVREDLCDDPEEEDRKILKSDLEYLSEQCLEKILAFGKRKSGAPISDMAPLDVFA